MKLNLLFIICFLLPGFVNAQAKVNSTKYNRKAETVFKANGNLIRFRWPVEENRFAEVVLDMDPAQPLFKTLSIAAKGSEKVISSNMRS